MITARGEHWRAVLLHLGVICLLVWPTEALARCDIRPTPRPLPRAEAHEVALVTQNLWRFVATRHDGRADKPVSEAYLAERLDDIAFHIRVVLREPHLLALQEVENIDLLERLSDRIVEQGGPRYRARLIEGFDPSGIDVALLWRDPVEIASVSDLFRTQRFNDQPLFSRPPLKVGIEAPLDMELVIVHLRSGRHLDDARRGRAVREKRQRQAALLRDWLVTRTEAGVPVAVAGDFNSARGDGAYAEPLTLLLDAPVSEVWQHVAENERYSYVYRCQPQAIDNILLGPELATRVTRGVVSRGNAGYQHRLYRNTASRLVSDHDAVAVFLRVEPTHDGSPDSTDSD